MSNHHDKVIEQFGPNANAYLSSAVHAQGADLDRMADIVAQRPGGNALDLGCGGGHVSFRLASLAKSVLAFDLSDQMLSVVSAEAQRRGLQNLLTRKGAAETLEFASGSFDTLVSRYSAHHWQNLSQGIREARRVLKDDGIAIFIDVIAPAAANHDTWLQTVELLRDPSHVRDATLEEWQRIIQAAGFSMDSVVTGRLRLAFLPWIERIKTPPAHVAAIRSLQQNAEDSLARYFELEDDGSFTVDTVFIVAKPVSA